MDKELEELRKLIELSEWAAPKPVNYIWAIYYREREYAKLRNDPLLGYVCAPDKEIAEEIGYLNGLGDYAGCWAVQKREAFPEEMIGLFFGEI